MLTRSVTITALSFLSPHAYTLARKHIAQGNGTYHLEPFAPANGPWQKSQETLLLESV